MNFGVGNVGAGTFYEQMNGEIPEIDEHLADASLFEFEAEVNNEIDSENRVRINELNYKLSKTDDEKEKTDIENEIARLESQKRIEIDA